MKTSKKLLCVLLVVVMAIGVVPFASAKTASDYTDIASINPRALEPLSVMTAIGIIDGFPDGSFGPEKTFTRAQAATIVARMLVGPNAAFLPKAETGFRDVPVTQWANAFIAYCVSQGIVKGYGDGRFGPEDSVTDLQFAAMLLRALGKTGYEGEGWEMNVFTDATGGVADLGLISFQLVPGKDQTKAAARDQVVVYAFKALTSSTKTEVRTSTKYVVTATGNSTNGSIGNCSSNGSRYDTFDDALAAAKSSAKDINGIDIGNPLAVYGVDFTITAMMFTESVDVNSLGDKVFKLTRTSDDDAFMRPNIVTWWYLGAPIYSAIAADPVKVYTTAVTGSTLFNDLKPANVNIPTFIDGKASGTSLAAYDNLRFIPFTGNGVRTEVYAIGPGSYRMVIINTYLGQILTQATPATPVAKAYVNIIPLSATSPVLVGNGKFEDATLPLFAKLLYTAAYDKASGQYTVKSAKVATSITVTPTFQNAFSFIADGKTYMYSPHAVGTIAAFDVITHAEKGICLDDEGYVIMVEAPAVVGPVYAVVLATQKTPGNTWNATQDKFEARILKTDGTIADIVISEEADFNTIHNAAPTAVGTGGDIVTLVPAAGGAFKVTKVTNRTGTNAVINRNSPVVEFSAAIKFNANIYTLFFVETFDAAVKANVYKVYTGIAAVPNIASATSAYAYIAPGDPSAPPNTFAAVVFVRSATLPSVGITQADVIYVNVATKAVATDARGTFCTYAVVTNGVVGTLETVYPEVIATDCLLGAVEKNEAGLVTRGIPLAPNAIIGVPNTLFGIGAPAANVVAFGTATGSSLQYFAYNDSTQVFFVSMFGITKSDVGMLAVAPDPNDMVICYTENSVLKEIYITSIPNPPAP